MIYLAKIRSLLYGDFWHSGTRPSLRRVGGRCRVAAICQADLF
jgi:hypothetical protein